MTEPGAGADAARDRGRLDLAAVVRLDLWGTAAFTALALAASVLPDQFAIPYAVWSGVLFVVGTVAFGWAFLVAVARSREEFVSTAGVYLLTDRVLVGPPRVRLLGCLAAQVVVAIAAASIHLYTAAAFGIMAPMFGLDLAGLAGARFGTFEARPAPSDGPPDAGDDR